MFSIILVNSLNAQEGIEVKEKDEYRNIDFFNITRFSYILVNTLDQDISVPGQGTFSQDLPTDNSHAYSLQTINGYFLTPHLSVGIGVGLDGYRNPTVNTFPVFIDVRAYLDDDFNSAFIYLDGGTLIPAGGAFERGGIINIGAGFKVFVDKKKRIALLPEIGYAAKGVSLTGERVKTSDNAIYMAGVQFSLGIIF